MLPGQLVPLLNDGYIRLVDYMGNDMSVVRAARVSYAAEPRGDGSDEKLINYLWRNGHTSPFESVQFMWELKAPIFVLRQWWRHRTIDDPTQLEGNPSELGLAYQKYWSYNEVSARYTELPEEYYVPAWDKITVQSASNKQARTDEMHPEAGAIQAIIERQCYSAFVEYHRLIAKGCPRELARAVLPVATYTHTFATVDLHNLLHFLRLRLHPHAQYEIRVYAEAMLDLIRPIVPWCVKAFETNLINPEAK